MNLLEVKQFLEERLTHKSLAQDEIFRFSTHSDILGYEQAYRTLANDSSYTVNQWCNSCVGDMVQRVWQMYSELPQEQVIEVALVETTEEPIVKSKAKKSK